MKLLGNSSFGGRPVVCLLLTFFVSSQPLPGQNQGQNSGQVGGQSLSGPPQQKMPAATPQQLAQIPDLVRRRAIQQYLEGLASNVQGTYGPGTLVTGVGPMKWRDPNGNELSLPQVEALVLVQRAAITLLTNARYNAAQTPNLTVAQEKTLITNLKALAVTVREKQQALAPLEDELDRMPGGSLFGGVVNLLGKKAGEAGVREVYWQQMAQVSDLQNQAMVANFQGNTTLAKSLTDQASERLDQINGSLYGKYLARRNAFYKALGANPLLGVEMPDGSYFYQDLLTKSDAEILSELQPTGAQLVNQLTDQINRLGEKATAADLFEVTGKGFELARALAAASGGETTQNLINALQDTAAGVKATADADKALTDTIINIGQVIPVAGLAFTAIAIYQDGKDYVIAYTDGKNAQAMAAALGYQGVIDAGERKGDAATRIGVNVFVAASQVPGVIDALKTGKNVKVVYQMQQGGGAISGENVLVKPRQLTLPGGAAAVDASAAGGNLGLPGGGVASGKAPVSPGDANYRYPGYQPRNLPPGNPSAMNDVLLNQSLSDVRLRASQAKAAGVDAATVDRVLNEAINDSAAQIEAGEPEIALNSLAEADFDLANMAIQAKNPGALLITDPNSASIIRSVRAKAALQVRGIPQVWTPEEAAAVQALALDPRFRNAFLVDSPYAKQGELVNTGHAEYGFEAVMTPDDFQNIANARMMDLKVELPAFPATPGAAAPGTPNAAGGARVGTGTEKFAPGEAPPQPGQASPSPSAPGGLPTLPATLDRAPNGQVNWANLRADQASQLTANDLRSLSRTTFNQLPNDVKQAVLEQAKAQGLVTTGTAGGANQTPTGGGSGAANAAGGTTSGTGTRSLSSDQIARMSNHDLQDMYQADFRNYDQASQQAIYQELQKRGLTPRHGGGPVAGQLPINPSQQAQQLANSVGKLSNDDLIKLANKLGADPNSDKAVLAAIQNEMSQRGLGGPGGTQILQPGETNKPQVSGDTGGNTGVGGNAGTATQAPAGTAKTTNATGGNAGRTATNGPTFGTTTTNIATGAGGAAVAGNLNNATTGGAAQNLCPPNCNEVQLLQAFHDDQDAEYKAKEALETARTTAIADQDAMSAAGNAVATGKGSQATLDAAIAKNQASQTALEKAQADYNSAQQATITAEQAYDNCVKAKKNCPPPQNATNQGGNNVADNNPNNPPDNNSSNNVTSHNPSANNSPAGNSGPGSGPVANPNGEKPAPNKPVGNPPVANPQINGVNTGKNTGKNGAAGNAGGPDNNAGANNSSGGNNAANNGGNNPPGATPANTGNSSSGSNRPPDFNKSQPYTNAAGQIVENQYQVTICKGTSYVFPIGGAEVDVKNLHPSPFPGEAPDATAGTFGNGIRIFGKTTGGNFIDADVQPTDGNPGVHIRIWVHVIDCNPPRTTTPPPTNSVGNPPQPGINPNGGNPNQPVNQPGNQPAIPGNPNGPGSNGAGGTNPGANNPGGTNAAGGNNTGANNSAGASENPCDCDEEKLVEALIAAEQAETDAKNALATAQTNLENADAALNALGAQLQATPANSPAYPGLQAQVQAAQQVDADMSGAFTTTYNSAQAATTKREEAEKALQDCRDKKAQAPNNCPPKNGTNQNVNNSIGSNGTGGGPQQGGTVQQASNATSNNSLPGGAGVVGNAGSGALLGGLVGGLPGFNALNNSLFGNLTSAPMVQNIVVTANVNTGGAAPASTGTTSGASDGAPQQRHGANRGPAEQTHARVRLAAYRPGSPSRARPALERNSRLFLASLPSGEGLTFSIASNGNLGTKALEFHVHDPSGRLKGNIELPEGTVLEPLKPGAPNPVSGAASGSNLSQQLTAYCLEMAKLPPEVGQLYRLAAPAVQQKYQPIRTVLEAGSKLAAAGGLHPDSDPAAYADFIRQHALWAQLENWSEQKFTEVFLERTKKNAEHLNVKWTKAMTDALRAAAPGRWRDIATVLDEAHKLSGAAGAP